MMFAYVQRGESQKVKEETERDATLTYPHLSTFVFVIVTRAIGFTATSAVLDAAAAAHDGIERTRTLGTTAAFFTRTSVFISAFVVSVIVAPVAGFTSSVEPSAARATNVARVTVPTETSFTVSPFTIYIYILN